MKSLHVVAYEKFLPHIIDISEEVNPGANRYIVCSVKGEIPLEIKKRVPVIYQNRSFRIGHQERKYIEWCEALFLHPLNNNSAAAVEGISPDKVVVWCGMGQDFYRYSNVYREDLLQSLTKQEYKKAQLYKNVLMLWFPQIKKTLKSMFDDTKTNDAVKRVAHRVDFFCAQDRHLNLQHVLTEFKATQIDNFGYYSLDGLVGSKIEVVSGSDILVGNSASWNNNHFDFFEKLKHLDLKGRKIILPLNYGSRSYAAAVERRAVQLFGSKSVISLRNWMPIAEYNFILSRCGTVFMNHMRGQAMGTISSMLYRGARVYLHSRNAYCSFFEDLGVKFYKIPEGPLDASVFDPLGPEERRRNAKGISDYWAWSEAKKRTKKLFSIVDEIAGQRKNHEDREKINSSLKKSWKAQ